MLCSVIRWEPGWKLCSSRVSTGLLRHRRSSFNEQRETFHLRTENNSPLFKEVEIVGWYSRWTPQPFIWEDAPSKNSAHHAACKCPDSFYRSASQPTYRQLWDGGAHSLFPFHPSLVGLLGTGLSPQDSKIRLLSPEPWGSARIRVLLLRVLYYSPP